MAGSPAHKFGQTIGDFLELILTNELELFCSKNGLYLDYQKKKRPARKGKKVTWVDDDGNAHDLDFVIERDGTDEKIGEPLAFIEAAWRRYTKHSKNKVQEIQGAVLPLANKYSENNPFMGAILAGKFTSGAIKQLQSLGFIVLYIEYQTVINAFNSIGFSIDFEENTPDTSYTEATINFLKLNTADKSKLIKELLKLNNKQFIGFFRSLENTLLRVISRILIIPLYGTGLEFSTIDEAKLFISEYDIVFKNSDFYKFEVHVEYSNGEKFQGYFITKSTLVSFLDKIKI